jgi:hypothetical protein
MLERSAPVPSSDEDGAAVDEPTARSPRRWNALPDEQTARRRLRWWREIVLIVVLYEVYTYVRNTFGSNGNSTSSKIDPEAVATSLGHAHDVINIERHFGLFFEPHLQHWYLGLPHHGFIRFWNIYYGSFHFLVPVFILIWMFKRHPRHYTVWRNTLVVVTVLGLVGFASFSLMPPRLLNFAGEYGGCSLPQSIVNAHPRLACHDFRIVDTLAVYGGLWNFGSSAMAHISNQYAAMPSLHIGWSTWSAVVLVPRMKKTWKKVAIICYPLATLFCILVTGNHYWLDALGGLFSLTVAVILGRLLALGVHRLSDRRDARREAVIPTVAVD